MRAPDETASIAALAHYREQIGLLRLSLTVYRLSGEEVKAVGEALTHFESAYASEQRAYVQHLAERTNNE